MQTAVASFLALSDPHTHIPWAGNRAGEFGNNGWLGRPTWKLWPKAAVLCQLSTKPGAASLDDLVTQNLPRLNRMLAYGTTSIDAKNRLWP